MTDNVSSIINSQTSKLKVNQLYVGEIIIVQMKMIVTFVKLSNQNNMQTIQNFKIIVEH